MEEVRAMAACQPTTQPKTPDVRATSMSLELFHNVCYIVCGVVVEAGRVLMVQEAKPSCRGKWYLPAGRMERNESIVEAVKREVKEESGLDFEPEALLSVECHAHTWVRFTLGGRIVGGDLKTVAQADQESLQAQWYPVDTAELPQTVDLRARDILNLITIAGKWYSAGKPYRGIPAAVGHVSSSLRLVTIHETPSHGLKVLVTRDEGAEGQSRLPVCLLSHGGVVTGLVQRTLKGYGYEETFSIVGVLQIEHVGQLGRLDGFCLSLLVHAESGDLVRGARCRWEGVREGGCEERLRTALQEHPPGCATLIDLAVRF